MRTALSAGLLLASAVFAQPAVQLTLKQAEQTALQTNPQIRAAQFTAQAAGQVPKELRSNFQPTVFGNLTTAGASDGSRIAAGALNNPVIYDRFASGLGVSQLIYDFGRTSNLVESANLRARAQDQNSQATRAQVLLSVDQAYYRVLRAQEVLKVAQETVAARQLVVDQVTTLAQNQLKSNLDVSFAQVNLSDAKLLLASALNDVKASIADLATAMGTPGQTAFTLADEPMPPAPPPDAKDLIQTAIQNRPELASLRYEQNAAARFVKAERALSLPSVGTLAAIGLVPTGATQLQNRYGAIGLNVTIPIFNGGLYAARRAEAEFRRQTTEQNLRDQQNRVMRDVQVAYLNSVTGYERLSLTAQLLDQAKLALDLAQSRYNLQLSSIVELSQAQLNLTSAQIATASARFEYQAQWSQLQYQIGLLR